MNKLSDDYPHFGQSEETHCHNPMCGKKLNGSDWVGTAADGQTIRACSESCLEASYMLVTKMEARGQLPFGKILFLCILALVFVHTVNRLHEQDAPTALDGEQLTYGANNVLNVTEQE